VTDVGARHQLLYDTEAALRLVDGEVRAMTGSDDAGPASSRPALLERAGGEVRALLAQLRERRAALDALADGLAGPEHATTREVAAAAGVLAELEARLSSTAERLGR
jgi:hypothetical protein